MVTETFEEILIQVNLQLTHDYIYPACKSNCANNRRNIISVLDCNNMAIQVNSILCHADV